MRSAHRPLVMIAAASAIVLVSAAAARHVQDTVPVSQPRGAPADSLLIRLPAPSTDGGSPLTRALAQRRSVRQFESRSLRLADVAQMLWAAQGVTQAMPQPRAGWRPEWGEWRGGLRTAPSAGALYPLELYLVARSVDGLGAGVYRYIPVEHALRRAGNATTEQLAIAALGQRQIADAPAVVVIVAVYQRTTTKYGDRGTRYVHIDAGAAAENLLLQATALGLGSVYVGAFRDDAVRETLALPADQAPLGLLPVGHPTGSG